MSAILDTTFNTPFNNTTTVRNFLTGQIAFSTVIGHLVYKLPFLQSAAIGLATEACRYATNKAMDSEIFTSLSQQMPAINNHKTAVKTALVAASFFLAHTAIKMIIPGAVSCLFKSSLLMTATYLFAEPIVKELSAACSSNATLITIKDKIHNHYKDNSIYKIITSPWSNGRSLND